MNREERESCVPRSKNRDRRTHVRTVEASAKTPIKPGLKALFRCRLFPRPERLGSLQWVALISIGAMTAARAAAGTALEMIGGGEDQIRPFEVIILWIERRRWICGLLVILVHGFIVADLTTLGEV